MPRRLEGSQRHPTECHLGAVGERRECIFRLRFCPEIDHRADAISKLEMSCDEIGMEMRQEHVADRQSLFGGERQILIDVALRVDDRSRLRLIVADEIRRVRETIEIKLLENHGGRGHTQYTRAEIFGVGSTDGSVLAFADDQDVRCGRRRLHDVDTVRHEIRSACRPEHTLIHGLDLVRRIGRQPVRSDVDGRDRVV